MTMVDLDFEETNFPDLLQMSEPIKKKGTSRRKAEREKMQIEDKLRVESLGRRNMKKSAEISRPGGTTEVKVPNQVEVPVSTTLKAPKLKPTKPSRVAVDPPMSPASSLSATGNRDDSKSKLSSSKLTTANLEKFGGKVTSKEKNVRDVAAILEKNLKPDKKLTHKSIKRDFIEQVSCENAQSRDLNSNELSEVNSKNSTTKTKEAPVVTVATASTKSLKGLENLSPKLHGINELEFKKQSDSRSSSVSSIPHEGCDDEHNDDMMLNATGVKPNPNEAHDLLERARDRIARQRLVEQVKALEMIVERKNEELEQLNVQLRRAIETKSDLVIAHNEIEKRHAVVIEKKEQNLLRMKQANIWLLEAQSIKEKELLNEIIRLTDVTRDAEEKRREELDDWERMHRNEMLEKDYTIARLSEELRKLGVTDESPIFKQQQRNNQKSFYDPTSIITGASKFFFN